ncbi:MAG: ACP S-malonyltransferase [Chloroflexota bacterium]
MSGATLNRDPVRGPRALLVFPGQGVQAVGMGRRAHERSQRARDLFARADAVLGRPLSRLCFEGPAQDLLATQWQQPAILTCSLAILAAFEEQFPADPLVSAPLAVAGHSLGEYSALVYAGALGFDEGVRLAHVRGSLMQAAAGRRPGGMAAVIGLSAEELTAVCAQASRAAGPDDIVVVANHNSPAQVVLSGTLQALEGATALARERGARRVVPLAVGGAFHSPLMEPAARELAAILAGTSIHAPRVAVLANTTGRPLATVEEVRKELALQVTAPVLWEETVRYAVEMGVTHLVEAGPGETLCGLARRTVASLETVGLEKYEA